MCGMVGVGSVRTEELVAVCEHDGDGLLQGGGGPAGGVAGRPVGDSLQCSAVIKCSEDLLNHECEFELEEPFVSTVVKTSCM